MVPSFVAVAVNVTDSPEQIVSFEAVMVILTGSNGVTVITTRFDVSGLFVTQVSLEVSMQVTVSLPMGIYWKREEFEPVSIPLIFHW